VLALNAFEFDSNLLACGNVGSCTARGDRTCRRCHLLALSQHSLCGLFVKTHREPHFLGLPPTKARTHAITHACAGPATHIP
jgi:hypothetical protein